MLGADLVTNKEGRRVFGKVLGKRGVLAIFSNEEDQSIQNEDGSLPCVAAGEGMRWIRFGIRTDFVLSSKFGRGKDCPTPATTNR